MHYILSVLALATTVYSHGTITSPPPRQAGAALKAACGEQIFNNQKGDNEGNIQAELQIGASQKDYNATACNLSLCKGYKFEDNAANIQTFTPGQVLPMTIKIGAPHTGTANVSIVDAKANAILGNQLIYFADYASTAHTIPANNTQFSVTIPSDLGSKCAVAGDCVLQWWWNSPESKQTYESCVDFAMGGSGGAPAPSPPAAAPAPPARRYAAPAPLAAAPTINEAMIRRHARDFEVEAAIEE